MAGLPDDRLDLGSAWSGFHVSIGFRLRTLGVPSREHTIQVEKTYALIGHVPRRAGAARAARCWRATDAAEAVVVRAARGSTRPSSGSPETRRRRPGSRPGGPRKRAGA